MERTERSSYGAYTRLAIALHWAIALAIIVLLSAGWWMSSALQDGDAGAKRLAYEVIQLHKALGLTVLALSLLRLFWRLRHPAPPLPEDMPGWQKSLSGVSHICLYGFMIGAPLTGWLMVSASPSFASLPTSVFGLFIAPHLPAAELSTLMGVELVELSKTARGAHHWLAFLGALLLALHIGAALKHHFVDRDHILARMTPWVEPKRPVFAPPAPKASGLAQGLANGLALFVVASALALALFSGPWGGTSGSRQATLRSAAPPSAPVASAPLWIIEQETSAIRFAGSHLGSPFSGIFESWSAEIRFDPAALEASRIRVEIQTASARTGNQQYDGALPQPDWFDAAAHPKAVFLASRFEKEGEGRFRALGSLRLKGETLPAILPFTLKVEGDRAEAQGALTLDRLAYGLGQSADPSAAFVAREVTVRIETTARRAASGGGAQ